MKIKKISIAVLAIMALSFQNVKSQESSIPFPVDEAGIAAYVKINDPGIKKNTELVPFYDSLKESKETHVIGTIKVEVEIEGTPQSQPINEFVYPYVYLDLSGWMVAYLPREDPSSKIMQWSGYSPGSMKTTVLEDAIKTAVESIGASYSEEIRYYHFGYPDANRITVISGTIARPEKGEDKYSVVVPGKIHEASYSFYHHFRDAPISHYACFVKLEINDIEILNEYSDRCQGKTLVYKNYDSGVFTAGVPHLVTLSSWSQSKNLRLRSGAATVLIYEVN